MATSSYRTVQGDTFDIISYRLWGSEHHAGELIEANTDEADAVFFDAGTALAVPEVDTAGTVSSTLPPWYGEQA